ncbi:MAG: glycoside hydrolase family 3 N-terminal domain-containing protein [Bacteroidales bacterium]|nr:glycoside hydrolase family 3 N-terminal domain-containing protein [Bacteroidales bacterium]
MTRTFLSALFFVCIVLLNSCTPPSSQPAIEADADIEKNIETWIDRLSLEEKVGQMTQLTIDLLEDKTHKDRFEFDTIQLDSLFRVYKVGSILNVPLSIAQDTQNWTRIITKIQEISMREIGIPCIYGVDQIHGTTYTLGGTLFPQGINMAASFNRQLVRTSASICAYETRAGNIPWTFAPVLDLGRDPRWPRMWENYGEDVFVNAEMGVEAVLGFQGNDPNRVGPQHIASCLKHYMGYGVPVSGKDRTPSSITPIDMREKHFEPFRKAVQAGALSVMVNSSSNDGVPFHANAMYLTKWLKEDLNWDGLIVTDWNDINNLYTRERVAHDEREAIKIAINAGIDLSMVPYSTSFCRHLISLVQEGEVSMDRIDDAVRRVLRLKYRLGLFERPSWSSSEYPEFASAASAAVALRSAEESQVLLKNKNALLPLKPSMKLLVTGPNANSMRSLNGGWSYSWQGNKADECAAQYNTIYEALIAKLGADRVVFEPGVRYNERGQWWMEHEPEIEKAVRAAKDVDCIIACIGENSYCETPGNLSDLRLSENQRNLIKALSETGKPIVLILNQGRPRIIRDIEPLADAVINAMLPGNYGGDALANLLVGEANFSAKLPFTYPKEPHSLVTYDYKPSEQTDRMDGAYNYDAVVSVQWAFGYGLSYTSFEYDNFRVEPTQFTWEDSLTFSVDVTNVGSRVGKEAVLLFSSDLVARITPDNRRLRAFDKYEIEPGETVTATFQLKGSDLAFVDSNGEWCLESGQFRMQAGNQVLMLDCVETKNGLKK